LIGGLIEGRGGQGRAKKEEGERGKWRERGRAFPHFIIHN